VTDNNGSAALISAMPERRVNPFRPELRTAADGTGPKHIWGYASMFNKLSRTLPGGFVERVNNRAFDSSKAAGFDGAVCRWNHNSDFLLGTIAGRTVMIDVNESGLLYDAIPPSFRSDIIELMERGDVVGSSFAFSMPDDNVGDDWALSDFGLPLRTLLDVKLVDVAPCSSTPAYPDATAALRTVDGAIMSLAHKFDADPVEVRTLFSDNRAVKLFKRSDQSFRPSVRSTEVVTPDEVRGQNADFYEVELRKDFSKDDRDKLAKSGHAMPDGSYPIEDEDDLKNAVKLSGNGKGDPNAIKAHIKQRAVALGKTNMLPDDWQDGKGPEKKSADEDAETRAAEAAAKDKSKADATADEDEDEDGSDSSGNGTEAEGRVVEEPEEERAAKAGYDDLETCGNCGSTGQFGKHCTDCGNSMEPPMPKNGNGKFCANCGGKMPVAPAKRTEHACAVEERTEETPAEETHQVPGTSDNGKKVYDPAETRHMLASLQDKRFDQFDDEA
jgi:HK97 family phage prohead protease